MAQTGIKVLTAHVHLPLAEKVDQMAESGEARAFARLDHKASAFSLMHEALADVDAGRIIDYQAVQAWADSLSTPTNRCRCLADGAEVDQQGPFRLWRVCTNSWSP